MPKVQRAWLSLSQRLRSEPRQFKPDCVCSCQPVEDGKRIILEPKWLRPSVSVFYPSLRARSDCAYPREDRRDDDVVTTTKAAGQMQQSVVPGKTKKTIGCTTNVMQAE